MKRTPLKRTAMPRYTAKTGQRMSKEAKWRKAVKLLRGEDCQITGLSGTEFNPVQCAHVFGKGAFPWLKYEPINGVRVLKSWHDWSHYNPEAGQDAFLKLMPVDERERLNKMAHPKGKY